MGLGLFGGGAETARHLAGQGLRVTVTDLRSADLLRESIDSLADVGLVYALGGHREEDFVDTDLVVANPAVAPGHPLLAKARAAGVPVTSEMALFLEACPARLVLVTGTQGKSSTSHAVDHFLRAAGFRSHLGGNIGRSLLGSLGLLGPEDWVVLEISSYQLEALPPPLRGGVHGFARNVAAVCCTNVLADHLERHGSVENYEAAKARILELCRPDSVVVLGGDDPRTSRWTVERGRAIFCSSTGAPGARARLEQGEFRLDGERLGAVSDLGLPGNFQRDNTLAALALARAVGADPARLAPAVATLQGLEHRLQDLGPRGGLRVWDNGVSTTPDSTIAALASARVPVVLLCGGQAKAGLPLEELVAASAGRVRALVSFGAARETLREAFSRAGIPAFAVETVEQAVREAYAQARHGDELLFSPACASFDRYRNFKDRALAFRSALPPAT
jgi:UDP-N-acetylmuramoylalanine--D-glutamate ligase